MSKTPNASSATATRKPAPTTYRSITDEIATLRELPTADLVEKYESLFGKPPRSKHRAFMWRRIQVPGATLRRLEHCR